MQQVIRCTHLGLAQALGDDLADVRVRDIDILDALANKRRGGRRSRCSCERARWKKAQEEMKNMIAVLMKQ